MTPEFVQALTALIGAVGLGYACGIAFVAILIITKKEGL